MIDLIIIIPTIGRNSLLNTIESIKKLNINNWKCLLIFDGIERNVIIEDNRFIILETEKLGKTNSNNAGLVRNYGLKYIDDNKILSKYICFVDDDDTINPYYIDNLNEELKYDNEVDVIIFRMMYKNFYVLPTPIDYSIKLKKVGISFAIKYNLLKNKFINHDYEDFIYLKSLERLKYKIIISPFVNYFVKTNFLKCENKIKKYKRIFVNY